MDAIEEAFAHSLKTTNLIINKNLSTPLFLLLTCAKAPFDNVTLQGHPYIIRLFH